VGTLGGIDTSEAYGNLYATTPISPGCSSKRSASAKGYKPCDP